MLPPFIIEQIRKREERKKYDERPVLELPIEYGSDEAPSRVSPQQDDTPRRGVIIIDL